MRAYLVAGFSTTDDCAMAILRIYVDCDFIPLPTHLFHTGYCALCLTAWNRLYNIVFILFVHRYGYRPCVKTIDEFMISEHFYHVRNISCIFNCLLVHLERSSLFLVFTLSPDNFECKIRLLNLKSICESKEAHKVLLFLFLSLKKKQTHYFNPISVGRVIIFYKC